MQMRQVKNSCIYIAKLKMSQDFRPVQPHKYGRSLPSPQQCTYMSLGTSTFSFEKGSGMQRVM